VEGSPAVSLEELIYTNVDLENTPLEEIEYHLPLTEILELKPGEEYLVGQANVSIKRTT
jgi:hypothetical protein